MDRGYLKLWRKSLDSEVFASESLWKLWCCCLMLANHKEKYFSVDGIITPVKVEPGQFVTGRFSIHKIMYPKKSKKNPNPLTVWRWLQSLETSGNLNIKTNNKYSVITIANWDSYQVCENENEHTFEQQLNNNCTTTEQQLNTTKNVKNVKNEENKDTPARKQVTKAFRPPSVDEVKAYCLERGNSIDPEYFIDKYTGNGWMVGKSKMKCWKATVRTWEKNNFQTKQEKPMSLKEKQALELLGY